MSFALLLYLLGLIPVFFAVADSQLANPFLRGALAALLWPLYPLALGVFLAYDEIGHKLDTMKHMRNKKDQR